MMFKVMVLCLTFSPAVTPSNFCGDSAPCLQSCCCWPRLQIIDCLGTNTAAFPLAPSPEHPEKYTLVDFGYNCEVNIFWNNLTMFQNLKTFKFTKTANCSSVRGCLYVPPTFQSMKIMNLCTSTTTSTSSTTTTPAKTTTTTSPTTTSTTSTTTTTTTTTPASTSTTPTSSSTLKVMTSTPTTKKLRKTRKPRRTKKPKSTPSTTTTITSLIWNVTVPQETNVTGSATRKKQESQIKAVIFIAPTAIAGTLILITLLISRYLKSKHNSHNNNSNNSSNNNIENSTKNTDIEMTNFLNSTAEPTPSTSHNHQDLSQDDKPLSEQHPYYEAVFGTVSEPTKEAKIIQNKHNKHNITGIENECFDPNE